MSAEAMSLLSDDDDAASFVEHSHANTVRRGYDSFPVLESGQQQTGDKETSYQARRGDGSVEREDVSDSRCASAGRVLGGFLVLAVIALVVVLGVTDKGQELVAAVKNRHSTEDSSSTTSVSVTTVGGGDDAIDATDATDATDETDETDETEATTETDEVAYAPYDTMELGFQRRGYNKLPYWGSDAEDAISYQFLKKYDTLVEPNADMHFGYYGDDNIDDSSSDYYSYAAYDVNEGVLLDSGLYYPCKNSRGTSTDMNVACAPHDELRIDVRRLSKSGSELYAFNLTAVCLYVRRELRTLDDADLNATMNAMFAIWSYSDEEGQELFGDDFHSSAWFTGMHDFNAAWSDGDHIHEGLGFLPQHMKMTNLFESAMQAADPSVSLFYWDFTIESTLSESFFSSPMFTADTFGSLTKSKKDGTAYAWTYSYDSLQDSYIPDGRWAKAKVNLNSFQDLASPYGYMRGPWNANPAPYITRFAQDDLMIENIPSCKVYMSWLETNDFGTFLATSENAPHASIHGGIGGVFGCEMLDELYDAGYVGSDASGEDYRDDICEKWPFYMKELYRGDMLTFRQDCSTDEELSLDGTSCGYVCNPSKEAGIASVLSGLSLSKYVSDASDATLWDAFKNFTCTGNAYRIFSGDHLESASPADPSFWPIHPTQERLFQAKMMAGGFDVWVWPNTTGQATPVSTFEWICNHSECYDYADASEDKDKDYYSYCCAGHFADDQLFDFESGDRSKSFGLSNRQIFEDADPTNEAYALSYVYDNFDWSHCAKLAGYDIKSRIVEMFANATETNNVDGIKPWA